MTPLYLFDGKLLLVGDALAASSGCCCDLDLFYCYKSEEKLPCDPCPCDPGQPGYRYFGATNSTNYIEHPVWGVLRRSESDPNMFEDEEDPPNAYYKEGEGSVDTISCVGNFSVTCPPSTGVWKIEPWFNACEVPSGTITFVTIEGESPYNGCDRWLKREARFHNYPMSYFYDRAPHGIPLGWTTSDTNFIPLLYVSIPTGCAEFFPVNTNDIGFNPDPCASNFFSSSIGDGTAILEEIRTCPSFDYYAPEQYETCCVPEFWVNPPNGLMCEINEVILENEENPPWKCQNPNGGYKFIGTANGAGTADWHNAYCWVDANNNPVRFAAGGAEYSEHVINATVTSSILTGNVIDCGGFNIIANAIFNMSANNIDTLYLNASIEFLNRSCDFGPTAIIDCNNFIMNGGDAHILVGILNAVEDGQMLNGSRNSDRINCGGTMLVQDSYNAVNGYSAGMITANIIEFKGTITGVGELSATTGITFYNNVTVTAEDTSIGVEVGGYIEFKGNSQNYSNSLTHNKVVFYGNSRNYGTINGDAEFRDNSRNYGTVTGDADFQDNSCNSGTVNGTTTGNPPACP
jgi:hypothetical protein